MSGETGADKGAEKEESFEVLLARLESIVSQLEGGARPLDESLALYESGVAALKRCHTVLDKADKRIRLLLQDGQGNPQLRDAEIPNRGAEKEKGSSRRAAAPVSVTPSETVDEDAEDDPGPAREVQKKVENSEDQRVDSEADSQHNSPTSVKTKPKPKPGQSGNKAGGLLFGSAQ